MLTVVEITCLLFLLILQCSGLLLLRVIGTPHCYVTFAKFRDNFGVLASIDI